MFRFRDFVNIRELFFPQLCIACRSSPRLKEEPFCLTCQFELPLTDNFFNDKNAFVKHFWGRVPIKSGAALFEFRKDSIVQSLVHDLKYRRKRDVGVLLGSYAARQLLESTLFHVPDLIIPVPISSLRRKKRGYNQSLIFADGIAKTIDAPLHDKILLKIQDTGTQTARSRQERMDKVAGSFKVRKKDLIKGKHILIADDVITTGATLESCASLLLSEGAGEISCLTIAIAKN